MAKLERQLKNVFMPKRWIYGIKKEQWYLVDKKSKDFKKGLTQREFRSLGVEKAKERYLHSILI